MISQELIICSWKILKRNLLWNRFYCMIKSNGSLPSCKFSEMKCPFWWNNFFCPWENYYFTGKKIFSPQENFAWREKIKLRSFFPLNFLLQHEDSEHPAASLSLQQPAKGGNMYLGAWLLCQPRLFLSILFLWNHQNPFQQEEKIPYGSFKTVLFSWNSLSIEQKNPMFLSCCPS